MKFPNPWCWIRGHKELKTYGCFGETIILEGYCVVCERWFK